MNISEVEGKKADKVLMAVNLGNGFANYALVGGIWWSVNMCDGVVQDVRWQCQTKERDQIIAVFASRLQRKLRPYTEPPGV